MEEIYTKTLELLRKKPEFKEILEKAIEQEEEHAEEPHYLGWEWYAVETPGAKLSQLVYKGIAKVNFSSRSSTNYLLKDREAVGEALAYYDVMERAVIEVEEEVEIPSDLFEIIVGYEDVKELFNRALESEKPVGFLLLGPPSSAKTLFLLELARLPRSYYALGSRASGPGLADILITRKPRFLLIDEIDRLYRDDYGVLLSLMQTGIVAETKYKKERREELKTWVFAAANTKKGIPAEVLSRFEKLRFPEYNQKQFREVVVTVLTKREGTPEDLAEYIANTVWWELDSKDPREAVRIARLCKDEKEVDALIKTLKKYR